LVDAVFITFFSSSKNYLTLMTISNLDYLSDRKFCQLMTTYKIWQMAGFEAFTGESGLECSEKSTLLKTEQDFAEDRCPSIQN